MSNVEFGSPSPKVSVEISYRGIGKSHMVLQKSAMKELRRYLSFTQLRFHCRKKQGRTFHVVTASNSSGDVLEKMDCDDDSRKTNDTNGDFWRVFVR